MTSKEFHKITALIVEDDFTSRVLLQRFLSRYGECHIAVNGKEAISAVEWAVAESHPYDLVCMDILMPEMDGHEALKRIRAFERDRHVPTYAAVKIIMTTGVQDIDTVTQVLRDSASAYLLKPIDLRKLLSLLNGFGLITHS